MDKVKAFKDSVTGAASDGAKAVPSGETADPGQFPQTGDFPVESQVERPVGIQQDMKRKPEAATVQEDESGYDHYKAAGKLIGKKSLITGGDSGIGRAVAVMFAMEGSDVAIVYLPEEQVDAEKTKSLITATGRQCLLFPQDIRDEAGCKRVVDSVVQAWGRIDVLINNASVMYSIPDITDISTEQFDRTVKTNIYGTFFMTRAAVPHIPKGGCIIITSSQVAFAGPPMLVDYAMTKGALVSLTRCLSNQLLPKGIRVASVAPGPVWTPLQPAAMNDDQMKSWHSSPAPIGRIGQPSELGPAYVFLASQDASFISGEVLQVNGGTVIN